MASKSAESERREDGFVVVDGRDVSDFVRLCRHSGRRKLKKTMSLSRVVRNLAFHFWGKSAHEGYKLSMAWCWCCRATDGCAYALVANGAYSVFDDAESFVTSSGEEMLSGVVMGRVKKSDGPDFNKFAVFCKRFRISHCDQEQKTLIIDRTSARLTTSNFHYINEFDLFHFVTEQMIEKMEECVKRLQRESTGEAALFFCEPMDPDENVRLRQINVTERLGYGSFSQVFAGHFAKRTRDTKGDDEKIAIKVASSKGTEALKSEFRILQKLHRCGVPNVINLISDSLLFEYVTRLPVMLMEYGVYSIADLVNDREKTLSLATVRSIVRGLLTCIMHCHRHNILHLDIKAKNVVLKKIDRGGDRFEYETRVIDWGLSRVVANPKELWKKKCIGTIYWRSPEMVFGADYAGEIEKSDVWGCGCVLAYMLAGSNPFEPPEGADRGKTRDLELRYILNVVGTKEFPWSLEKLELGDDVRSTPAKWREICAAFGSELTSEVCVALTEMLRCDPKRRVTAESALKCPFFSDD